MSESELKKIIKICAQTFQEQNYISSYEEFEKICLKKINSKK